ncbi:MAG: hypothetical protein ACD_45C00322G0001 [uncultured bacterium]|nr:MAG: hypothetical protein ACD_45C00322G0001 [uncultured bacterium]
MPTQYSRIPSGKPFLADYVALKIQHVTPANLTLDNINDFFNDPNIFLDLDDEFVLPLFLSLDTIKEDQFADWIKKLDKQLRDLFFKNDKKLKAAFEQSEQSDYWEKLWYHVKRNSQVEDIDIENAFVYSYIKALIASLKKRADECKPHQLINKFQEVDKMTTELHQSIKSTPPKKSYWDKTVDIFGGFSEAANIGIVSEMVNKWWPAIMVIGHGFFSTLAFITDPVIYCFKSLIRITRLVGRNIFGVTFDEEKNGTHKWQTAADLTSLGFFAVSVPLFFGLILTGPIGITVGWVSALIGLSIVGYVDYAHQAKLARENYINKHKEFIVAANEYKKICESPDEKPDAKKHAYEQMVLSRQVKDIAYKEYKTKQYAKRLFMGLLVGLAVLLICGSAALFAPPALAPILFIASKVASGYLGLIAAGRFFNWARSGKEPQQSVVELAPAPAPSPEVSQNIHRALQSAIPNPKRLVEIKAKAPQIEGLTVTEANEAIRKYETYKKSRFFNKTSIESVNVIDELRGTCSDPSKTDLDRALLANSYFADRKNEGKAFYNILSETMSERVAKSRTR